MPGSRDLPPGTYGIITGDQEVHVRPALVVIQTFGPFPHSHPICWLRKSMDFVYVPFFVCSARKNGAALCTVQRCPPVVERQSFGGVRIQKTWLETKLIIFCPVHQFEGTLMGVVVKSPQCCPPFAVRRIAKIPGNRRVSKMPWVPSKIGGSPAKLSPAIRLTETAVQVCPPLSVRSNVVTP